MLDHPRIEQYGVCAYGAVIALPTIMGLTHKPACKGIFVITLLVAVIACLICVAALGLV